MEASTSAPMAMAMPPNDMMLAEIPMAWKGRNEMSTAMGMVMIGMMALGMCQRNSSTTADTVRITSMMVDFRLPIALRISSERS